MRGKAILLGMLTVILTMGAGMNANAGLFGLGGTSWKEEVLLHDGTKIVVERTMDRGGRHEIGQKPPIKEQSLSFTLPSSNERIIWTATYSKEVGYADLRPLLLDFVRGVPYLVTDPVGCLAYNKWKRPNPPYIFWRYLLANFCFSAMLLTFIGSLVGPQVGTRQSGFEQREFTRFSRVRLTCGEKSSRLRLAMSWWGRCNIAPGMATA